MEDHRGFETRHGQTGQKHITEEGVAKGLRTILNERGVNTSTMKADDMRIILPNHIDFIKKSIVEHYCSGRGHLIYFLPKFHCELNAIERVWTQAKVYWWTHINITLFKLKLSTLLFILPGIMRRPIEQDTRLKGVETAVKSCKSHRRMFNETVNWIPYTANTQFTH